LEPHGISRQDRRRQDRYSLTTIFLTYSSGRSSSPICCHRLWVLIRTSWTTSSASPRSPVSTPVKRSTAGSLAAANSSYLIVFPIAGFSRLEHAAGRRNVALPG